MLQRLKWSRRLTFGLCVSARYRRKNTDLSSVSMKQRQVVILGELLYLFIVKGCRAGCCLGMQMILGELRLGLPRPELPMLLVLPLIPIP